MTFNYVAYIRHARVKKNYGIFIEYFEIHGQHLFQHSDLKVG